MSQCTKDLQKQGVAYPRTCAECGLGPCKRYPKASNVVPLRTGAVVGEWDVKMRMIFGGPFAFEFDLPEMSMDAKSAADLVEAFRSAVKRAIAFAPSIPGGEKEK